MPSLPKSRPPVQRIFHLSAAVHGAVLCTVTETAGGKTTCSLYWLRRQPSDFGLAFQIEKPAEGLVYDVLLNGPGGGHTCDCPWGAYKGHVKACRHIEACLLALDKMD
jgi:hypothetical protein